MGGHRSGRPREHYGVEDLPELRVAEFTQSFLHGQPERVTVGGLTRHGHRYSVEVEPVPQHFGGVRWWLLCPRCGARRGALYHNKGEWGCRTCLRLSYPSQRDGHLGRYWRLIEIQKAVWLRLGGTEESFDEPTVTDWPPRPLGMHHVTRARLQAEYARLHAATEAAGSVGLDAFRGQLRKRAR